MAPNRRNIAGLLQALNNNDLANLQSTVQPKFLPLTHPTEESKNLQQQEQSAAKPQHHETSVSYWDWPADVVEDDNNDLFSASRIEANLVRAAAAETTSLESQLIASHDDYWAESDQQVVDDNDKTVVRAQHVDASYWEWPATCHDTKQATIKKILADEKVRQQFSAASIEATETRASAKQTSSASSVRSSSNDSYWQWDSDKVAAHTADPSHPNAGYWDWEAEEPASSTIQAILDYEAARELLSATGIARQLQSAAPASSSSSGTKASSDNYWTFREHYGDEYWQATSVPVAASGTGYWDW